MGIHSAALFGAEKYALELQRPIVFGHIYKVKRGYYEARFSVVEADPKASEKGEITQRIFRVLEEDIRRSPELWLWTHKRWKHTPGFYADMKK
jgi:Kdo2-lipid IVA lauroyltransferase/acyltransferase